MGRDAELERLGRTLDDLALGRGGAVAVSGEPGIGKTRLVRAVLDQARRRGWTVLRGRGAEFERELPYGVLVDALDPFFAQCPDDELARLPQGILDILASVVPSLGYAGGAKPAPTLTPDWLQLQHAVRDLLAVLGARTPVVLALDDLHWADEASIQLVRHLLRAPPGAAQLTVLAYRPATAAAALQSAVALAGDAVTHLQLEPLSPPEVDRLIEPVLDTRAREPVTRLGGGNPFYLLELARLIRSRPPESWPDGDVSPLADTLVPAAVRFAIADELATLDDDAHRIARGAAVSGEPFDLDLARRVAEVEPEAAGAALGQLLERDLVRPAADHADGDLLAGGRRFAFRHPVVRHAVYQWSGEGWRIGAHARAAAVLAERGAPVSRLAHHVERSAPYGDAEAVALLERAGRDSAPHAPANAAHWFRSALRLVRHDDVDRRLSIFMALIVALRSAGNIADARQASSDALALLPPERAAERVELVSAMARFEHLLGDVEAVRRLLSGVLAELGHDPHQAAIIRLELAIEHWLEGDEDAARQEAIAAREHLQGLRRALAETVLALVELGAGRAGPAREHVAAAADLAAGLGDDAIAERVELLALLALVEHGLGLSSAALNHVRHGIAVAQESCQETYLPPLLATRGLIEVAFGQLDAAHETARLALEAAEGSGGPRARMTAAGLGCLVALERGDTAGALRAGEQAEADAAGAPSVVFAQLTVLWRARALHEAEQHAAVAALLLDQDGRPHVPAVMTAHAYALLTVADIARGRLGDAEGWVLAAERDAGALDLPAPTAAAQAARASWLLAVRDADGAAAAAAKAAAAFTELGYPLDAARADALAGRALAAAGARAEAIAALERAHTAFADAGAERARDRLARELRALGRRVARRRTARGETGVASLTARQREVAERVARGYTNRQIAAELFLSEKTVETHLSNLFTKLGATSRADIGLALAADPEPADGVG